MASASPSSTRVILLLDLDCFYAQVETVDDPTLLHRPVACQQYNNGGIIATNYPARAVGIRAGFTAAEARRVCPDIIILEIDMDKYRAASFRIMRLLEERCRCVEKASIDEAFLDVSDEVEQRLRDGNESMFQEGGKNFVWGHLLPETYRSCPLSDQLEPCVDENSDIDFFSEHHDIRTRLAIGSHIATELRSLVFSELGYTCSVGVSNNKTISKVACGLNKPNGQTTVFPEAVSELFSSLPLRKIRGLGGKLGAELQHEFGVDSVGQVTYLSLQELKRAFPEKTALWIYDIVRGIDSSIVQSKGHCRSILSELSFPPLHAFEQIDAMIGRLSKNLARRILVEYSQTSRLPKTVVLRWRIGYGENKRVRGVQISRSWPVSLESREEASISETITRICSNLAHAHMQPPLVITRIAISAIAFASVDGCSSGTIESFFQKNSSSRVSLSDFGFESRTEDFHLDTSFPSSSQRDSPSVSDFGDEVAKVNKQVLDFQGIVKTHIPFPDGYALSSSVLSFGRYVDLHDLYDIQPG